MTNDDKNTIHISNVEDFLTDRQIHHIFLSQLDAIIDTAIDFIKDDGPEHSEPYINDLAAATHIRQTYIDLYNIED